MLLYLVIEEKRTPAVFLSYSLVSDNKSRLLLHLVRVFSRYSAFTQPPTELNCLSLGHHRAWFFNTSWRHHQSLDESECCCHGSISGIHQVVSKYTSVILVSAKKKTKMNSLSFIKLNHLDGKSAIKEKCFPLYFFPHPEEVEPLIVNGDGAISG